MSPTAAASAIVLCLLATPLAAQIHVQPALGVADRHVERGHTLVRGTMAVAEAGILAEAADVTAGASFGAVLPLFRPADRYSAVRDAFAALHIAAETRYGTVASGVAGNLFYTAGSVDREYSTVEWFADFAPAAIQGLGVLVVADLGPVGGAYGEVAWERQVRAGRPVLLRAVAGASIGQARADFANYASDGITHVEATAAVPLRVGRAALVPRLHVQRNVDAATQGDAGERRRHTVWLSVALNSATWIGLE